MRLPLLARELTVHRRHCEAAKRSKQSTNKHGVNLYGERQAFASVGWWIASPGLAGFAGFAMTMGMATFHSEGRRAAGVKRNK
jgi:hypothetical protein